MSRSDCPFLSFWLTEGLYFLLGPTRAMHAVLGDSMFIQTTVVGKAMVRAAELGVDGFVRFVIRLS
jgi:hypothetical protein